MGAIHPAVPVHTARITNVNCVEEDLTHQVRNTNVGCINLTNTIELDEILFSLDCASGIFLFRVRV